MAKIKIYTAPGCPYCYLLKEYLKSKNVSFEEIDVSKDEKAAKELIQKTNQMVVPVLEFNGEIVVGFDKEKIDQILESNERI